MELIKINYKEIKPYWRNPRNNEGTIPPLIDSIKKFGFRVPLVLDEKNVIVTGHTRWKAIGRLIGQLTEHIKELKKQKKSKELIENLTELNKGIVPVLYAKGLSEKEVREYRISDNKVSEFSGWDDDALETELKILGNAIGFSTEELEKLIGAHNVQYETYTNEEIDAEREKLNEHFSKLSDEGNQYIDLICPKCSEEFSIKKDAIKKESY